MLRNMLAIVALTLLHAAGHAQGVAINNNGAPAHASASLEVGGSQKGVLIPRLTTEERNQVALPATALLIFNKDVLQFQVNVGTPGAPVWKNIVSADQPGNPGGGEPSWLLGGNEGNNAAVFIGTKDAKPFTIKTNNLVRVFVDSTTTKLGIGTTEPKVSLDVNATDAIIVPVGTTAQRPSTPTVGMIRFNNTSNKLEGYTTNGWVALH